ncbi:hypothetical protein B835_768 [Enterococcus mundtii 3F]|uniref:hypothetical protein n=1 Tax=Enterococcus mundtii TaxID=53346 RepID=UPI000E0346E0|nr:hypothetical protein [Enterococcus mundtii]MDA9460884.1 hypothetical protein [Enterococcus mundtii 3F]STD26191.1 Uncharacterised protein [Enterococcus mundtii]
MVKKKLVLFGVCLVSLTASLLGATATTTAEEVSLPISLYAVQPDSVSRSNIWIKGTSPYVYYQEQAYGTLYRGYLGLAATMPNGWGIYEGRLYRLGLPYPIPTRMNIEKGDYNNGK